MADARALFIRHAKVFDEILKKTRIQPGDRVPDQNDANALAIIYGSCIIAEAIRTEMDETDFKHVPGYAEQKWPQGEEAAAATK